MSLGWETGFDFAQYEGGIRWRALVCYTGNIETNGFSFSFINTSSFRLLILGVFVSRIGLVQSRKLETWKPQCLLVKRQRSGTTSSCAKCCDNGIGERAFSVLD